jgi:hypothetical protein
MVEIGNKKFTLVGEWYDASSVYQKYYALKISNGFSIYTFYEGYILFFIEIGENNEVPEMHVNYYVKYSALDTQKIIGDENLIKFISTIGYYFNIGSIALYANYMSCDINLITIQQGGSDIKQRGLGKKENLNKIGEEDGEEIVEVLNKGYGGSYCVDITQYLENGIRRYEKEKILNIELRPRFSYFDLDLIKTKDPLKILDKQDRDEIYQMYEKIYLEDKNNEKTISAFYIWIKNNYCYLLNDYVQKINRIFGDRENPFINSYYILDPISILYNRNEISGFPDSIQISEYNPEMIYSDSKKNKNRLISDRREIRNLQKDK